MLSSNHCNSFNAQKTIRHVFEMFLRDTVGEVHDKFLGQDMTPGSHSPRFSFISPIADLTTETERPVDEGRS